MFQPLPRPSSAPPEQTGILAALREQTHDVVEALKDLKRTQDQFRRDAVAPRAVASQTRFGNNSGSNQP